MANVFSLSFSKGILFMASVLNGISGKNIWWFRSSPTASRNLGVSLAALVPVRLTGSQSQQMNRLGGEKI